LHEEAVVADAQTKALLVHDAHVVD